MLPLDEIMSLLKLSRLFDELKEISDFKLQLTFLLQAIEDSLPLKIRSKQKNSEESVKLRKQADQLFNSQKGNTDSVRIHKIYSQSIALAKPSTEEEAQAYANRSAILYNMLKYKECISDIDRALTNNNYSNRLNLLNRKIKCLTKLLKEDDENICEETRYWLKTMSLKDTAEEQLKNKIDYLLEIIEYEKPVIKNNDSHKVILPEVTPHEKIPSASEAVDIKYNKSLGKHLVANRDIGVGEILIIEEPYVKILSRTSFYTHCSHCFIRTWGSIACEHCIYTMYCSEKCREEAWQQYHDIECSLKGYFVELEMDHLMPFTLKLTVLAVKEAGSINKLRQQLKEIDDCQDYIMKSCSEDGMFYSNKYKSLYNLVTHRSDRNQYERLTSLLNISFVLFQLLTNTSFFGKTLDKISDMCDNEDILFIGNLMEHHQGLIQINNHEFSEFEEDEFVRIGSSISAISSLLNHSCNANVGRCPVMRNNKAAQLIYALQPIKAGDQILDDYGANFAYESKPEREKLAKEYFFECNCRPCIENWPVLKNLPSIITIIMDKEVKLEIARAIIRSMHYKKIIYEVGIDNYKEDKLNILVNLANIITIFSKSTDKPSEEYSEVLEMFRIAFAFICGNKLNMYEI